MRLGFPVSLWGIYLSLPTSLGKSVSLIKTQHENSFSRFSQMHWDTWNCLSKFIIVLIGCFLNYTSMATKVVRAVGNLSPGLRSCLYSLRPHPIVHRAPRFDAEITSPSRSGSSRHPSLPRPHPRVPVLAHFARVSPGILFHVSQTFASLCPTNHGECHSTVRASGAWLAWVVTMTSYHIALCFFPWHWSLLNIVLSL